MRRRASGQPDPVDIHVGGRVRLRRTLLGMNQAKLGNALGLTFQQVQKYERGANRIGSSRLYQLACILDVPVGFFFDDMAPEISGRARGVGEGGPARFDQKRISTRETLELVRAYYRIGDGDVRKRIFDMVKATAATLDEIPRPERPGARAAGGGARDWRTPRRARNRSGRVPANGPLPPDPARPSSAPRPLRPDRRRPSTGPRAGGGTARGC